MSSSATHSNMILLPKSLAIGEIVGIRMTCLVVMLTGQCCFVSPVCFGEGSPETHLIPTHCRWSLPGCMSSTVVLLHPYLRDGASI